MERKQERRKEKVSRVLSGSSDGCLYCVTRDYGTPCGEYNVGPLELRPNRPVSELSHVFRGRGSSRERLNHTAESKCVFEVFHHRASDWLASRASEVPPICCERTLHAGKPKT